MTLQEQPTTLVLNAWPTTVLRLDAPGETIVAAAERGPLVATGLAGQANGFGSVRFIQGAVARTSLTVSA